MLNISNIHSVSHRWAKKREKKNQIKLSQIKNKLKIILISNLFPNSMGTVQASQCLKNDVSKDIQENEVEI